MKIDKIRTAKSGTKCASYLKSDSHFLTVFCAAPSCLAISRKPIPR